MRIGIIGQGFVGSAIREGLKGFYRIYTYDVDSSKCNNTHQQVCDNADIIFVCVLTPMKKTGECNTDLLEFVVKKISNACELSCRNTSPVVVIKSTVPPGTTERVSKMVPNLNLCFSPEFLTEANSFQDFKNQTRIIIGGDETKDCDAAKKVKMMFRKPFPGIPIVVTKRETAEMVKYFTNCFLATKVIFSNEIYQICQAAGLDYDKVTEYALHDTRLGRSHFAVPGPDGDFGYGGHCFPKDMRGLIYMAEELGLAPDLLNKVVDKNDMVRENRDWEAMIGRAVSYKKGEQDEI
jgi:nucleotide sugar dehydrogenase